MERGLTVVTVVLAAATLSTLSVVVTPAAASSVAAEFANAVSNQQRLKFKVYALFISRRRQQADKSSEREYMLLSVTL